MAKEDGLNMELPLESVSDRLRAAREAAGLTRTDIAARTKIAERHLAAIEEGRFGDLASRTYAIGFARNYARALGLDEMLIAREVRDELKASDSAAEGSSVSYFEPGDPSRIPGRSLAWLAALAAVAVIAGAWIFWPAYFGSSADLPALSQERPAPSTPQTRPLQAESSGQVVVTAQVEGIWIRIADETGVQLIQKVMAMGESYALPLTAKGPVLSTARPDALAITIDGKPQPALSNRPEIVRDVPVSAAALLARGTPSPPAAALARTGPRDAPDQPARARTAPPPPGTASPPAPETDSPQAPPMAEEQLLPPAGTTEASTVSD